MRVKACPIIATSLMLATAPIAGAEPQSLARSSKWQLTSDQASCRLMASFGSNADEVIYDLSQIAPDTDPRLELVGNRFGQVEDIVVGAKIHYAPSPRPPVRGSATMGGRIGPESVLPLAILGNVRFDNKQSSDTARDGSFDGLAGGETATSLSVAIEGIRPFKLEIGDQRAALAGLRECTANLVSGWGFDPDELGTRKARAKPKGNINYWAVPSDFPRKMLNRGHSATVTFRAMVDSSGAVTGCHVHQSTDPQEFGAVTCERIMRRARFVPALNKDGLPVSDYYINTVQWLIAD